MSATMTMMFEVEDLAVASPATVSRCGMIYMEPTSMGVEPLLTSFLQTLPETFEPFKEEFTKIFMSVVPGLDGVLFFIRKQLKETVTTVDNTWSRARQRDVLVAEAVRAAGAGPGAPGRRVDAQRVAPGCFLIWGLARP